MGAEQRRTRNSPPDSASTARRRSLWVSKRHDHAKPPPAWSECEASQRCAVPPGAGPHRSGGSALQPLRTRAGRPSGGDPVALRARQRPADCRSRAPGSRLASGSPKSDSCGGGNRNSLMAVAIYARVSTEEQQQRQSIRTQIEFGQRYCQLHTLAVHHVYDDDGVSGTIPLDNRPAGSRILRDARLGRFDQLLVYKLDRLMLSLLSSFASHEHSVIRERCVAGTLRVAEAGAWLGGIVPYGYRKEGEKRDARLVVSANSIPGLAMSEPDVIREVFRMASVERVSCRVIADRLNSLSIPCAYVRDDRLALRGKRKERTSGVWRPGRIRALITNKTYLGIHEFGKRSASGRPVISRPVPAIVTEANWKKAQKTLQDNFLFGKRSARNQYLLRGLIKCALCGP